MRGWYRQYQMKDQSKMILESRGETLLTINDRLAALPLKVCLPPAPPALQQGNMQTYCM